MSGSKGVQKLKEWNIPKYNVRLVRYTDNTSSYSGHLMDWLDDYPHVWDWGAIEAMESILLDLAASDIEISEAQVERLISSTLAHLTEKKCEV